MWSGLQVFEVLLRDSGHHLVILQVLFHLHVIRVRHEERVSSCHRFIQLIDLKEISVFGWNIPLSTALVILTSNYAMLEL